MLSDGTTGNLMVGCPLDGSDDGSEIGVLRLENQVRLLYYHFHSETKLMKDLAHLNSVVDVRGRVGGLKEYGISGCTV